MRERTRGIALALRSRDFRLLWLAQVAGDLGDALGRIALAVLVFDETESSFLAAAVFGVVVLPFLGPGQALTAWAERFPRRTVLVACDLLRAACFAAIALPVPIGVRFAVLLVASMADPPFLAIRRALVPTTVPEARFSDAVTLTAVTAEVCILVGAALAGVLADLIGPTGVLVIDAGTFLASAALLLAMRAGRVAPVERTSVSGQLREGVAAIRADGRIRRLAWLFPVASAGALGAEALITPLVKDTLDRSESIIGLLAAVVSVGVLATTVALHRHSRHDALVRQTARIALVGGCVAFAGFVAPAGLLTAVVAYLGIGVVFAFRVPSMVVVGQRLADTVRASAMSVLDSGYALAQLAAAFGAGAIAEATDPRVAAMVFAMVTVVAAGVALVLPLRGAEHVAVTTDVVGPPSSAEATARAGASISESRSR